MAVSHNLGLSLSSPSPADKTKANPSSQPPPNRLVGLLVTLAVCCTLAYFFNQFLGGWQPIGVRDASVGRKIETLFLESLTGDAPPVDLASLKGKVTVLHFWGTWCLPCRAEFPELLELQAAFIEEPRFRLAMISTPSSEPDLQSLRENTEKFLKQFRTQIPTYHDPNQSTALAIGLIFHEPIGYPTTVLLDEGGVIRAAWRGSIPHIGKQIEANVRKLLDFQQN